MGTLKSEYDLGQDLAFELHIYKPELNVWIMKLWHTSLLAHQI